jgi:hypothetical protein
MKPWHMIALLAIGTLVVFAVMHSHAQAAQTAAQGPAATAISPTVYNPTGSLFTANSPYVDQGRLLRQLRPVQ